MTSMNLNNIDILNIKNANYCCIINGISKSEALALLQNINLHEKMEHYKNWRSIKIFEAINLLQILIEMKKVEKLN